MIIRILIILSVAFVILQLEGCKHNVPDFPAEYVFYFEHGSDSCIRFQIVSQDPIKLGNPESMSRPECPAGIVGIDAEITPKVRDWIKDMQKALKSCK
jgi:hypothetical protein